MSTQVLLSIAFPLVLGLIMFGLGTALTWSDFAVLRKSPRTLAIGLAIQMIGGPLLAFAVIKLFSFSGPLAFGFMLLAAVPGGPTSNLFSHLAKGDVALNVSLTAINSALGVAYVPLFLMFASELILESSRSVPVPAAKIAQTILIVLLPVALGMLFRKRKPEAAKKIEPWVQRIAVFFIILLAVIGVRNEWKLLTESGFTILFAVLLFNILNLVFAYGASRMCNLAKKQAIAITFEVGVHNCIMAITIAMSPLLFNSVEMALPAVFYSVVMQVTSGLAVQFFRKTVT